MAQQPSVVDQSVQTGIEDDYPISGDPSKYVTLPVQNEKIWRKYQTTLEWFWTVYDVYLSSDKDGMSKAFDKEKSQCLLKLLAFMFTTHYTTITKDLFMDFMSQVDVKEASYYFGSQADSKKTHCMMYSMILDELSHDDQEQKDKLISALLKTPSVRDYIRWSIQNTTSNTKTFSQRLLAFASIQGIIYAVPFIIFNWITKQHPGLMPGLKNSNELIWRDEKLNLSFSCMLFEYIDNDLEEDTAKTIVNEAVEHAKTLFTKTIPVSMFGLEINLIEQFIQHSADRILVDVGFKRFYNKENPFDWAEEPKVDTYQQKTSMNTLVDLSASFGEAKFDTDLEF